MNNIIRKEKNILGFKLYFKMSFLIMMAFVFVRCSINETSEVNKNQNKDVKIDNVKTKVQVKQVRFIGQWMNEGKRGDLIRDFCREYQFENQDVNIDLKFPEQIMENADNRQANIKFVSDLINKSRPEWDIIRINNQIQAIAKYSGDSLWAKNNLVDFSEYSEFNRATQVNLLSEQIKEEWVIPGPFLEGSYWALWTNKNVTEKLGIHVKQKGMTVADFLSYLKAVDDYNQVNPNDYIIPIHEAADWKTSFAFVFQMYASALNDRDDLFSKNLTENKLNALYQTLKVLEEISKFNPFEKNWQTVIWSESNLDLIHEKCLFYVNGSWMYNIWEDANSKKVMDVFPAEFPVFNPINVYPAAYYVTWGVLKKSPNRDEAVKLLLAMNTPEVADMWVQYTKCPTGIKGQMYDIAFGADQFESFTNHIQSQYGNNIYNYAEELTLYILGNSDASSTYFREVLLGKMSALNAMQQIRAALN